MIERYKGYLIQGTALRCRRSEGTVFERTRQGSIVLGGAHIDGAIFENKQAAEDHGLELMQGIDAGRS
jgi:hypothetical protein